MMNRSGYGLGVLASLALTGLAAATVHVKYLDSSNGQIGSIANYSSGAAITVNISSSSIAKVMVYSDTPTSDNIGTISVIGTNTAGGTGNAFYPVCHWQVFLPVSS